MAYTPITNRLIELTKQSSEILDKIDSQRGLLHMGNGVTILKDIQNEIHTWWLKIETELESSDLSLEAIIIRNILKLRHVLILDFRDGFETEERSVRDAINELVKICQRLEDLGNKKKITQVFVDDLDVFSDLLKTVNPSDIDPKFTESAFLEDDVENVVLEIIGEPYKEYDSGAETRDLSTSRITINKKRYNSVIMFKGRGVKGPLKLSDCGKNGDQLLKLAKNSMASLIIVQHVNKIEPEVLEALRDHLAGHSNVTDIKICAIDGMDTARILKAKNKDLAVLAANRSNSGRKAIKPGAADDSKVVN